MGAAARSGDRSAFEELVRRRQSWLRNLMRRLCNDVTLADALLVPQVYNARRFKVPLDDFPKLVAISERCSEIPAFRDAAPEAQADATH